MAINVGDKVTCSAEYDYDKHVHLASFVRTNTYDVIQVNGNRVVIGKGSAVTAAVDASYLTVISSKSSGSVGTTPVTETVVKEAVVKTISGGSDILANQILSRVPEGSNPVFQTTTIDGSAVQYMQDRYNANESSDYNYTINEIIQARKNPDITLLENYRLSRSDPLIVQNAYSFPRSKGFDSKAGYYRYSYYMDYDYDKLSDHAMSEDFPAIHKSVNMDVTTRSKLFANYTQKYNRYKLENPNDQLSKSFAHVFFVRPDCNIYADGSSGISTNPMLISSLESLSEFYYAKKHCPDVLRQLTQSAAAYNHQFMLYPSNKARSFKISDEYITSSDYGQGITGFKIPYGKDNVESRTSGSFSIDYIDDRDLHMYNLHKLWTDYISYVYRGKVTPQEKYILSKVLDYATCVYYILCAEDGETIIFWSKYWGVFPLEAPSSGLSYSADNAGGVKAPELSIEYKYAWKEDFNPLSLIEFNTHSSKTNHKYVNSYQNVKLGTGYTWGGAPFIETFNGTTELPYTFKLRFRPES